jgi:hypothetical protein
MYQDFTIKYFPMTIEGMEDHQFVVAKLRRVSSPPIPVGEGDSQASALGRLADIFRLGSRSRNFHDLKAVESFLKQEWNTDPKEEWAACKREICRATGVERLALLAVATVSSSINKQSPGITFHKATMNELPYSVARVGSIFGSPAPMLLTYPNHQESAFARLADVFKIGVGGQAFRDFVESGHKQGQSDDEIAAEWRTLSDAMLGAEVNTSTHNPGIDKIEHHKDWTIFEEHGLSGQHVFSGMKMDGKKCLDYILDIPSREELIRKIHEQEATTKLTRSS